MVWKLLACAVLGVVFGSWNGAIIISRSRMREDIRQKGSGNAGLTNFLRNYGGWQTLLVVLIDVGKTVAACLIAALILPQDVLLAKAVTGLSVQLGHIFPVFFDFRGGKGVLCCMAAALMLDWRIFLLAVALFFVLFFLTRFVSLASVVSVFAFAVLSAVCFFKRPLVWILTMLMAGIVIFMHRSNLKRLFSGEERKTYFHKYKNERGAQ